MDSLCLMLRCLYPLIRPRLWPSKPSEPHRLRATTGSFLLPPAVLAPLLPVTTVVLQATQAKQAEATARQAALTMDITGPFILPLDVLALPTPMPAAVLQAALLSEAVPQPT